MTRTEQIVLIGLTLLFLLSTLIAHLFLEWPASVAVAIIVVVLTTIVGAIWLIYIFQHEFDDPLSGGDEL